MTRSRLLVAALIAGMGFGMLGPVGSVAAAETRETQVPRCEVDAATLSWGFKETFRAYIDGSIANGEWTTADGATYETPVFSWSGGDGHYEPTGGNGSLEFTGSIRFTGHDGLLDTTFADPRLNLSGDTGMLTLDVSGPSMDGTAIDIDDVPFVQLVELERSVADGIITIKASTVMTAEGEGAFPDYQAGTEFDPVVLSVPVGEACAAEYVGDPVDTETDTAPNQLVWVIGAIAAALLIAAGLVTTIVVLRRRAK